jgi:hypothetical protein
MYVISTHSDAVVADAGNCSGCSGFYGRVNPSNSGSFAFYGKGNLILVAGNGETGTASKPTGTTWINASDARLKKDITDFTDRTHPTQQSTYGEVQVQRTCRYAE